MVFGLCRRWLRPATRDGRTYSSRMVCKPERDGRFARLVDEDVEYFRSVLCDGGVVMDELSLSALNEDWMGRYRGCARLALRPENKSQVSRILEYANRRRLAVVPQGGKTSLVGGSVPVHDEILLCMSRMNRILGFEPVTGVLSVEAGAILQNVNEYLSGLGHIFPIDLGAKGSCQVGGNVATNAGGIRLLRYGSLSGSVLGLEVVLADGSVLDEMSKMRKNNTGLNLKQLFVGSEGLLGIITSMNVLCPPLFKSVHVMFLALNCFDEICALFLRSKIHLGEIMSAFEFMDGLSVEFTMSVHGNRLSWPMSTRAPFYVLIETQGSDESHDKEKVMRFLERMVDDGVILDGVVAQNRAQLEQLWFIRESIPESLIKENRVYKYDVSLPIDRLYRPVELVRERLSSQGSGARAVGYGHLGDCNLHLNVFESDYSADTLDLLEPFVYEYTTRCGGSFSAEHGIGIAKNEYLPYGRSKLSIDVMRRLKSMLDPNGIMNPYKMFPR